MVHDTLPPHDPRLVFNALVEKIAWNCDGVTLTTRDGRSFFAREEVILTLPLGVLQRKHASLFEPSLSNAHVKVLDDDGIVMGNLTHVLFQWSEIWWDDSLTRWVSANKNANTSAKSGEFSEWQNLNHASMLPGSNILLSFLGDPQSSRYEGMLDAEVEAAALARVREQNPSKTIGKPTDFFISRHGYNELSFGAYSDFKPGWKDKFMTTMKEPLKARECKDGHGPHVRTRIRWAGEAMCDDLSGFTHGGLQSGVEAAAHYLFEHELGPKPGNDDRLSLCNW